jgi:hypothetical protein
MNLTHQAKGVYRLPSLEPEQTWISYGALATIHYDMDGESPYWHEPPWQKFTSRPLVVKMQVTEEFGKDPIIYEEE